MTESKKTTSPCPTTPASARTSKSFVARVLIDTFRRNGARIGAVWIGLITFFAVFAPLIANSHPLLLKSHGQWSSPIIQHLTTMDVLFLIITFAGLILWRIRIPVKTKWAIWFYTLLLGLPLTTWKMFAINSKNWSQHAGSTLLMLSLIVIMILGWFFVGLMPLTMDASKQIRKWLYLLMLPAVVILVSSLSLFPYIIAVLIGLVVAVAFIFLFLHFFHPHRDTHKWIISWTIVWTILLLGYPWIANNNAWINLAGSATYYIFLAMGLLIILGLMFLMLRKTNSTTKIVMLTVTVGLSALLIGYPINPKPPIFDAYRAMEANANRARQEAADLLTMAKEMQAQTRKLENNDQQEKAQKLKTTITKKQTEAKTLIDNANVSVQFIWRTIIPYSPTDRQTDYQPLINRQYHPWAPFQKHTAGVHLMGTEKEGADVLSRMIHASRIALIIGFISTGIALTIGVLVGGLMGYYSGIVDILGMRVIEIFASIPQFFLLLAFVAFFPRNIYIMMVIIGLTSWVGYAIFTRAEFLKLRQQDFVQAAIACGLPLRSILFKHMLPNGITPVLVSASFGVASAILYESTLSFLGLGLVDEPSWGQLLAAATGTGSGFYWWIALYPGFAIFMTVLAYNFIGEAMRDAIDPHSKKSQMM